MRCRTIKKLILKSDENELKRSEQQKIKTHLSGCTGCSRFIEQRKWIETGLKALPVPIVSSELEDRTLTLCRSTLRNHISMAKGIRLFGQAPVPKLIWGVLTGITVLTIILAWPVFKDLNIEEPTLKEILVLGIMIQNFMMLLFSPLLLFRHPLNRSRTRAA